MAKSPLSPPTPAVVNPNRITLFSHRDSSVAYAEMERLSDLYFSLNRRNLTVDLFFGSGPDYRDLSRTVYSVAAYYGDQVAELVWLKENVKESGV